MFDTSFSRLRTPYGVQILEFLDDLLAREDFKTASFMMTTLKGPSSWFTGISQIPKTAKFRRPIAGR